MNIPAVPTINTASIKTWAIVAVVLLILLIGIAYYFYSQGAKQTTIAPIIQDTPGSNSPTNNPAGISDSDVKLLASQLDQELNANHLLGHDETPWENYLALSDTDFMRVYNQWNTDYQAKEGVTLAKWVSDEWGSFDDIQWGALQQTLLDRFNKLNLV